MKYKVLGMMSGTSLDGLDLAYCIFERKENRWDFDLKHAQTLHYTEEWRLKLNEAMRMDSVQLALLPAEERV